MTARSREPMDEALLSGYLDGELTQQEAQRVRLRLEEDPEARALYEDLVALRAAARGTAFTPPDPDLWSERPQSPLSAWSRGLGWGLLILWFLGLVGLGLWVAATAPESLWQVLLVWGGIGGVVLLLLSVVLDRLETYRNDPYRRVER